VSLRSCKRCDHPRIGVAFRYVTVTRAQLFGTQDHAFVGHRQAAASGVALSIFTFMCAIQLYDVSSSLHPSERTVLLLGGCCSWGLLHQFQAEEQMTSIH
jgi:hypothetical protein